MSVFPSPRPHQGYRERWRSSWERVSSAPGNSCRPGWCRWRGNTHTHTHTRVCLSVCLCVCETILCVFVCVCVCVWEREKPRPWWCCDLLSVSWWWGRSWWEWPPGHIKPDHLVCWLLEISHKRDSKSSIVGGDECKDRQLLGLKETD